MRAGIDTSMLLLLLDPDAAAPNDPSTSDPVTLPRQRIEHLISRLSSSRAKLVIPTPVVAEVLARAQSNGPEYLAKMDSVACIEVAPLDRRAAIELASLEREKWGKLAGTPNNPRQKVKVDRQIVAICHVHQVETIYADDKNIKTLCTDLDINVVTTPELPTPPEEPQREMDFGRS